MNNTTTIHRGKKVTDENGITFCPDFQQMIDDIDKAIFERTGITADLHTVSKEKWESTSNPNNQPVHFDRDGNYYQLADTIAVRLQDKYFTVNGEVYCWTHQ